MASEGLGNSESTTDNLNDDSNVVVDPNVTTETTETTETTTTETTPTPVSEETRQVLDLLTDIDSGNDGGEFSGVHVNPDADVQGLRQRLTDQLAEHGVRPDPEALDRALDHISNGQVRPDQDQTFTIPVHDLPTGDRTTGDTTPPPRGNLQLTVDREWRDTTSSPDRKTGSAHAAENRAKSVSTGAQQGRKGFNPVLPVTVIGEIAGKPALITPKLKTNFSVRQRGTEYQMSGERRHKRKVDVDGEDPARFTADITVTATLETTPPPTRLEPGGDQQGDDQRPQQQESDGEPVRVEFSDRLNDVVDVVLPGHLRTENGDGDGESGTSRQSPPQRFRTDDPTSREGDGNGTPIRAPRFSRTLGVLDSDAPGNFPVDMRTIRDNLGRADQGEVLRFPYTDKDGNTQFVEISGGPVAYERIGPEMKDSSFSDTDKSAANAQSSAGRSNKQDVRVGVGVLGTIIPGGDSTPAIRAGGEVSGGGKGTQKHTRNTEHGSERVYGPGTKGDSAFYRVTRTYNVTTTEPQPTPDTSSTNTTTPDTSSTNTTITNTGNPNTNTTTNTTTNEPGGSSAAKTPLVSPGTLNLTTLDQVPTPDARAMADAGNGTGQDTGPRPTAPSTPGLHNDGVDNLSQAVPIRSEWGDGRLRDTNGDSPMNAAARRIHQEVFNKHPELVNDPSGARGDRRGFWGSLWRGQDQRVQNTLEIYEKVGRAVGESDNLIGDGVEIYLRTGGLRNAMLPAPGKWRSFVSKFPGTSSVRGDDRDGADFVTVRLKGTLDDARFEGSRSGGSLSTSLNASTAQGTGQQNSTAVVGEAAANVQARIGSTSSGLPKGIVDFGGSYTFEQEKATPLSGNRKSGVESASSAKGDLDSWSYALHLEASIGTNTPFDVTPQSAGPTPQGPRVLVEGPKTTPVPGELGPFASEAERTTAENRVQEDLRQALDTAQQARDAVDVADTEVRNNEDLAGQLTDRENRVTEAERLAREARETADENERIAQEREKAAQDAEKKAEDARRDATKERLDAARDLADAARQRRDAIERALAYADALQAETDSRDRSAGGETPPKKRTARPTPLPDLRDTGLDSLGDTPDQNSADRAWTTALDNWNRLNDAEQQANRAVADAEADRDSRATPPTEGEASGTPPQRPAPSDRVQELHAQSQRSDQDARDLKDRADAQNDKASVEEAGATRDENAAADLRTEADDAHTLAEDSAKNAEKVEGEAGEARERRDESVRARDDLTDSRDRLTQALERERDAHRAAAEARGRADDHAFSRDRDTRLHRPTAEDESTDTRSRNGEDDGDRNRQNDDNRSNDGDRRDQDGGGNGTNRDNDGDQRDQDSDHDGDQRDQDGQNTDDRPPPPRRRAPLDLDGLPHAPKYSESPGLWNHIVNIVKSAPGFTAASRSSEAVLGHWKVLSSPKALAAHTMDVHDGGLPLQGQFEDGVRKRADLNLDISADRKGMRTSDAVLDSGLDLTYKTETDRGTGTSESTSHNTLLGLKGEGAPNQSDTRNNRVRGSLGIVPWASKKTQTAGDSNTFGEEDKVSLPGSTVGVTTSDDFSVAGRIRTRWNAFVSMPFGSTKDADGVPIKKGSGGGRTQKPNHTEAGSSESRYRVLDLAQKGALPGTAGLDTALSNARSVPDDIGFVPGRESSGYALNGIDTAGAVAQIDQQVREYGVELTDQSKHDIKVALSATNTRGTNRRLQTGGLVLPIRVREANFGEQRFSSSGWIRLGLGRDGTPRFHSVESGLASERSLAQSAEKTASQGKQKKHGVTAGLDGGFNPVHATGTKPDGSPEFPGDRYQSNTGTAGTGWESATTNTKLEADATSDTTTRTIKAPGVNSTSQMKVDFSLSLDRWYGSGSRGVLNGTVPVGDRNEVFQAGAFQPTQPTAETPAPPTPQAVTPPAGGGRDIQSFADDWRGGPGRSDHALPPPESVGRGPIADAALIAQARALGWDPDGASRDVGDAVTFLREGRAGSRADMLSAAVDEQVLRGLFGQSSDNGGATLVGDDPQGPFAVPGLETKLFTKVDPDNATIIGAVKELATGKESSNTHREEISVAHSGSAALNTGIDLSGMKGVSSPASGFNEGSALVGGGLSDAGASSTGSGGGKQASSTARTDAAAPAKGQGYLVRFPVDALLVAQDTASGTPPKAESTRTTVDVWLSAEQVRALATGVDQGSIDAWNTVAENQDKAADSEKELGKAVDNELGLDRSEDARTRARAARDLLSVGPDLDPRIWSADTSRGVQAIRDFLGSTAEDRGWNRPEARTSAEYETAKNELERLRESEGTTNGLSKETVDALSDLVKRRQELHEALTKHRRALRAYFDSLERAFPAPTETTDTTDTSREDRRDRNTRGNQSQNTNTQNTQNTQNPPPLQPTADPPVRPSVLSTFFSAINPRG
ncbi:hypothetical protein ABZ635_17930 [Nocardiopsis sp. NPDC007018]|uniref:hypothetical protein n=1 Tax=Nocardiopsis sp. NPDC007018 TaxID=3155721 RepID=UPI0033E6F473